MTSPAVTVPPTATIAEAARIMHERSVKSVPVLDEGGRLVGIASRQRGHRFRGACRLQDDVFTLCPGHVAKFLFQRRDARLEGGQ